MFPHSGTTTRLELQQAAKCNVKTVQERQKRQYDQKHSGMKVLKKISLEKSGKVEELPITGGLVHI